MKARFYYAGIRVRELKRSLNFYTNVLGMKVVNRGKMGRGGEYVQMVTPGTGSGWSSIGTQLTRRGQKSTSKIPTESG